MLNTFDFVWLVWCILIVVLLGFTPLSQKIRKLLFSFTMVVTISIGLVKVIESAIKHFG